MITHTLYTALILYYCTLNVTLVNSLIVKADSIYLSNSEDNVSGGNECVWGTAQLISHHLRQYHAYWLTQHDSLGFNSTDT